MRKFQEKIKGNFKNSWKFFQEIVVINKIRADFKYSLSCFWENFVAVLKMKIYKNFDEMRGKDWKTIEKCYENLKKKIDQF